ncbi:uncharacterized protein LTHEOB_7155 [Lasiodiplodia theobromae]|uniref:ER membrane protein complex subunit 7 beta-sandwich domain-containing protein n=1 Tax=Lasiodiplodia theobromae TaxID=45133 RepID=A0A5N5DP68_9PEZI|nr:uncharacterized protein LTHEOB_7155 [Lasiodiplodia theobromae]KAB2579725.1 hypothetical protein DBV05_g1700 [Lasiodiplodia theobromae]KAF4542901.1 hypothetical protein LTHEOB_7155 [Lasiodiplodia theobromae]
MRLSTATTATILASSAWLASAADLTFVIPPHPAALPAGASSLPSSTHATLHARGAPLSAPLRRDGTFVFADVAPGSYLLSVHGRDHLFENLRVDVEEAVDYEGKDGEEKKGAAGKKVEKVRAWQTFRGNEWANRGEKRGESSAKGGEMLAEVRVLGRKEYYQERSGFSPLAFLKNPMILMGVFSLALIVGMPYLMDNMDEETRAEFEEMQKSSPLAQNPAAQLQNFDLASFLAGKTNDQPQQSSQGGGSGSKKRG